MSGKTVALHDEGGVRADGPEVAALPSSKSQLLLEALDGDRVYELLLKLVAGGRLKERELEELSHLLPISSGRYSRALTDDAYAKPYTAYAAQYGKSVRTLKWYVARGKEHPAGPDLPPFDHPAEMLTWWSRVMSSRQKCPSSIEAAAFAAAGAVPSAAPSPGVASPLVARPAAATSSPPARIESLHITTAEQDLHHLNEDVARARQNLLLAQNEDPVDPAKVEACHKKWRALRDEKEKAEEALFKLRSKQGKLVDVDEFCARLQPKLVTIAQSIWSLRPRLKSRLAAASSEAEEDLIWSTAVDDLFTELVAEGFLQRPPLTLAAA